MKPDTENKPMDNRSEIETEEDGIRAGALRIAKYRHQSEQMRKRITAKSVTPEKEQYLQERERKRVEAIANAKRDAPIRDRFHAWLEGASFRKFETPPLGSSYPSSHVETLWEAYLDATLQERCNPK